MNLKQLKQELNIKDVDAWAVVNKLGMIPENNDDPKFLCVHRTKKEADGAALRNEIVVPCTITYTLTPKDETTTTNK